MKRADLAASEKIASEAELQAFPKIFPLKKADSAMICSVPSGFVQGEQRPGNLPLRSGRCVIRRSYYLLESFLSIEGNEYSSKFVKPSLATKV